MRVDSPIDFDVAQNRLNIISSLSEWYRLNKFIDPVVGSRSLPIYDTALARVVRCQRVLLHSAELLQRLPQIPGPKRIFVSGSSNWNVWKWEIPSSRAKALPTDGSSCISPYAFAYEITED